MAHIPRLDKETWREDLRYFVQELTQRHKNPFHLVTQESFDHAVAELYTQIPILKDHEIVVGIQSLAAMVGDGHTQLATSRLFHFFPFEVFWFGGELRILRTIPAYREMLGTRIVKIAGASITDVRKRVQALIPQGENRWYTLSQSAHHITQVEPLAALGILAEVEDTKFILEDDNGRQFAVNVTPLSPDTSVAWVEAITPAPLYLQRRDEGFWFTYLPDARTIYVSFRNYHDLEENAKKLWEFVDRQAPNRLIIDMRQNEGGNYAVGREHLIYKAQFQRAINRKGHLFIITGRATFSAAMTNVIDFHRGTDAIVVGEPMGARPNGYQEQDVFTLPNSQLRVSCSIFYYRFQDGDASAFAPDKRIDPEWTAISAGRDPVMEWILAQPSV